MRKEGAPSLKVNDNYRITNVGKKSLEVLYTRHWKESVRVADQYSLEKSRRKIQEILEQMKSQKENFALLKIEEQVRGIKVRALLRIGYL